MLTIQEGTGRDGGDLLRKVSADGMNPFDTLDDSEEAMATLKEKRWTATDCES